MRSKRFAVLVALTLALPSAGHAAPCPDFFRFVDFGIETPGGVVPGGPTFRAEGFDGAPLLVSGKTECRAAERTARDGPGNPIPIVARMRYAPEATGLNLTELALFSSADIAGAAEAAASAHRVRLDDPLTEILRTETSLCLRDAEALSCQIVSPAGGPFAPVVYCADGLCRMPFLALNEKVAASAAWPAEEMSGTDLITQVQAIYDFLAPLTSWRADFSGLGQ